MLTKQNLTKQNNVNKKKKQLLNGPRQSQACNQLYKPYTVGTHRGKLVYLKKNPQKYCTSDNCTLRIIAHFEN